jgi:hypothetical protein
MEIGKGLGNPKVRPQMNPQWNWDYTDLHGQNLKKSVQIRLIRNIRGLMKYLKPY